MDISIVIPVYNAEKFLKKCLESVLAALSDYTGRGEILLVNNISTDKSNLIIEEYLKKYPKIIRAFMQKKPGAAATRNYGVKKASGKYIWFIDADDTITKDSIIKLMNVAKKESADLVMMGAKRLYKNGYSNYLSAICPEEMEYKSRFVRYGAGPWQFIIRRAWWEKHDFRFKEGIIHEDMELMSALILYTDNFACVDEPLYNYYQNSGSVLHKTNWDPHCFDIFPALEGLYGRFKKADATEAYHDELEWFFIWNLLIDSAKDFSSFKEGRSGFGRSRKMLKQYFPNWKKNRFLKQKPLKLQVRVFLNYLRRK